MIPKVASPGPHPISVLDSTLIFNGDNNAFGTSNWDNNGSCDYESTENHTEGGSYSAYIEFDPDAWDAMI